MQQISPYNKVNTEITNRAVTGILARYNIKINIHNLSLYQQALTHKSYVKGEYLTDFKDDKRALSKNFHIVELQDSSNEALEFVGDTFIKCIIAAYIYKRYYDQNEGFLTKLKTRLEDTKSLAKYARRMNLGYYMLISKQIEDNNGRDSEKLLEDTFESFFGALYLDQGYSVVENILNNFLETEIDYSQILSLDNNYKDRLLRFYHDNKWTHPEYEDIRTEKINNKKIYTVGVKGYDGQIITEATDTSKKRAEQKASALALMEFGQMSDEELAEANFST
jgi:ribonuclease III